MGEDFSRESILIALSHDQPTLMGQIWNVLVDN